MTRLARPLCLFLLLLPAPALLLGGSLFLGAPAARAEEEIRIHLEDGVEIETLLKLASKQAGIPLVWDPADKQIRGKRIVGGLDLSAPKRRFLEPLRALLVFYELVMIPVGPEAGRVLLVMDARRASSILKLKAENIVLTDENLGRYEGADGLFVTTTIPVEHMRELRNARNALVRIVTGQNIGNVVEVPDARAFVVTDFAPNVVAVYRLIKQMDRPLPEAPPARVFQSVRLEHAIAGEAAGVLRSLFPGPQSATRARPARTDGPRIEADARTNSVLVSGNPEEVEQVVRALTILDQEAPEPEVHAHMLHLEHMSAAEAARGLVQLIASSRLLWRNPADPRTTPGVVAMGSVNALIVSASNRAIEPIRRLVAEMDESAREAAQARKTKAGDK